MFDTLRSLESIRNVVVDFGINRPRAVILLTVLITAVLRAAILRVDVNTDPEDMLPSDDSARVFNHSIKNDFGSRDLVFLGIINDAGGFGRRDHCQDLPAH